MTGNVSEKCEGRDSNPDSDRKGILRAFPNTDTQQLSAPSIEGEGAPGREPSPIAVSGQHPASHPKASRPTSRAQRAELRNARKARKERAADFMHLLWLAGILPNQRTVFHAPYGWRPTPYPGVPCAQEPAPARSRVTCQLTVDTAPHRNWAPGPGGVR